MVFTVFLYYIHILHGFLAFLYITGFEASIPPYWRRAFR